MTITLNLPEPPNIANARWHWRVKAKRKKQFMESVIAHARNSARPPADPHEKVSVKAHFRLYAKRDRDNLVASLKWVLDALEGIYYVSDDSDHLALEMPTQEILRKNRGLTLSIEVCGT